MTTSPPRRRAASKGDRTVGCPERSRTLDPEDRREP